MKLLNVFLLTILTVGLLSAQDHKPNNTEEAERMADQITQTAQDELVLEDDEGLFIAKIPVGDTEFVADALNDAEDYMKKDSDTSFEDNDGIVELRMSKSDADNVEGVITYVALQSEVYYYDDQLEQTEEEGEDVTDEIEETQEEIEELKEEIAELEEDLVNLKEKEAAIEMVRETLETVRDSKDEEAKQALREID